MRTSSWLITCFAMVLGGCISQDERTFTTQGESAPFGSGGALQCRVEDTGKSSCFPYRIERSSNGAAYIESEYLGNENNLTTVGALFHQLPNRPDDRYTLEVIIKTNQGYKYVPAVGWMTRPDSMQIYVPDCYRLREEFPEIERLSDQGIINKQCVSSDAGNRYKLFAAITALPKAQLFKASAEHRLTAVSMDVAQERMRTIRLESLAAQAKDELNLNIERTSAREYVAAFPARAQMQSYTEIYYGAPFIGTLFAVNFNATNVKCSAIKNNRTTCSWAQNVKVRSANALWASLAWNAPLMKDESLTKEFVFVDGKWSSPSLRALYQSRDAPASSYSGSSTNALDSQIEIQRRTSCAHSMLSNSSLGQVASALNC